MSAFCDFQRCEAELNCSKRGYQQMALCLTKHEADASEKMDLLELEANKVAFELDTRYHQLDGEGKKVSPCLVRGAG